MKRYISVFFCVIGALILFASCGKKTLIDEYGCFVNYEDALTNAQKKKQPLVVIFTSQGDDEKSNQIISDILKNGDFATDILKNYSVCHADFSQNVFGKTITDENASSAETKQANIYTQVIQNNYQLAMLFNIAEMPAVFLCTKEGYVVAPINLDMVTLAELKALIEDNAGLVEEYNAMVAATNKGSVSEKVEAIDTLYNATLDEYRVFLLPLAKKIPDIDKKNQSGLCGKYIVEVAEGEALSAYSRGDVETAVKKYLEAADNEFVNNEGKQECFYTAAYLVAYSGSDDYEGILFYLKTAYEFAPQSDKAAAIQQAIDYFGMIVENAE